MARFHRNPTPFKSSTLERLLRANIRTILRRERNGQNVEKHERDQKTKEAGRQESDRRPRNARPRFQSRNIPQCIEVASLHRMQRRDRSWPCSLSPPRVCSTCLLLPSCRSRSSVLYVVAALTARSRPPDLYTASSNSRLNRAERRRDTQHARTR